MSISSNIEVPSSCYCSLGIIDGDDLSIHTHPVVYIGLQPAIELSPLFIFIHEVYSIHVYIPIAIILRYEAVFCMKLCFAWHMHDAMHYMHDAMM